MKSFIFVLSFFVIIMVITFNAEASSDKWSFKEIDSLSLFYLGNQQISYQEHFNFTNNPNYKLLYTPWETRDVIMQYGIKARYSIYIFQEVTPVKKDTVK